MTRAEERGVWIAMGMSRATVCGCGGQTLESRENLHKREEERENGRGLKKKRKKEGNMRKNFKKGILGFYILNTFSIIN